MKPVGSAVQGFSRARFSASYFHLSPTAGLSYGLDGLAAACYCEKVGGVEDEGWEDPA